MSFVCSPPGLCYVQQYAVCGESLSAAARCAVGAVFTVVGAFVAGITAVQTVQRLLMSDSSHKDITCYQT